MGTQFLIEGADQKTGQDRTVILMAETADEAIAAANRAGYMVASCRPLDDAKTSPSEPPPIPRASPPLAPAAAEEPAKADKLWQLPSLQEPIKPEDRPALYGVALFLIAVIVLVIWLGSRSDTKPSSARKITGDDLAAMYRQAFGKPSSSSNQTRPPSPTPPSTTQLTPEQAHKALAVLVTLDGVRHQIVSADPDGARFLNVTAKNVPDQVQPHYPDTPVDPRWWRVDGEVDYLDTDGITKHVDFYGFAVEGDDGKFRFEQWLGAVLIDKQTGMPP